MIIFQLKYNSQTALYVFWWSKSEWRDMRMWQRWHASKQVWKTFLQKNNLMAIEVMHSIVNQIIIFGLQLCVLEALC